MIQRVHAQLNNADASAPDFPSVVLPGHGSSGVPSVSRRFVTWGQPGRPTSGATVPLTATEETSPQLRWWEAHAPRPLAGETCRPPPLGRLAHFRGARRCLRAR